MFLELPWQAGTMCCLEGNDHILSQQATPKNAFAVPRIQLSKDGSMVQLPP